jgi:uncharacterized protein
VKLRIDDITADVREIAFPEPEREINRVLGQGPIQDYRLEGPVNVSLSYYRAGTDVFLMGEIGAVATAACARCAEEFRIAKERAFRCVLSPKAAGYDAETDLRADDLEFSLYEGDEVDLTPLIREQVILALVERPLCREDCRGLCPHCGANLNQSACACQDEARDPRLAVLRTLKAGRR